MAQAVATTDHERIRRWAEERGGHPARVKRTSRGKGDTGILRIDFPGFSGEGTLEEISWKQFFDTFEKKELAFLYQDRTATGKPSRFAKLIDRASAPESAPSRRKSASTSPRKPVKRKVSRGAAKR
ncbi:hypothetical protein LZC95_46825 [Pendulispora brunnea]|uniref:1,4-alpha-glucan branching enzyme n=1 Tax=Pendulispora brunnea TaxID=2905690 RepID=A0ABZ2K5J0_9BACT